MWSLNFDSSHCSEHEPRVLRRLVEISKRQVQTNTLKTIVKLYVTHQVKFNAEFNAIWFLSSCHHIHKYFPYKTQGLYLDGQIGPDRTRSDQIKPDQTKRQDRTNRTDQMARQSVQSNHKLQAALDSLDQYSIKFSLSNPACILCQLLQQLGK